MRNRRVGNVRFVGRVVQNDGVVCPRVVDPSLQLLAGGDHAGRVVGVAEVDQVDVLTRQLGGKPVVGGGGNVNQPRVTPLVVGGPCAARHHVRVDVDRVDGVDDGDLIVVAEHFQNVPRVAFRAVRDEHLV